MSRLDKLKSVGKDAKLKESTQSTGKEYKSAKLIKNLDPEIERFFDERISKNKYSNYSSFIRAAVYELAVKNGYEDMR